MQCEALLHDFFELADALLSSGSTEIGMTFGGGEEYCPPVKIKRRFGLADVFKRNGEVVGVIRIVGLQVMGLKKSLLGVRPAVLIDISIAEREVQIRDARVASNELLDAGFRGLRVGTPEHADQSRLGERVTRVSFDDFYVMAGSRIAITLLCRNRSQSQKCLDVTRIVFYQLAIESLRRFKVARRQRAVCLGQ